MDSLLATREANTAQSSSQELSSPDRLWIRCSKCAVRGSCLPLGLDDEQLEELESVIEHLGPVQCDHRLFRAGDSLRYLFAVHSGSFKTVEFDEHGHEQVLGFHLPGDLMGLDGIYSGRHQCEAIAMELATVCRIEYSNLTDITAHVPALQKQFIRLLSKDIRHPDTHENTSGSLHKVAVFLLDWSRRQESFGHSANHFVLPMSRRDLGNYLGLAPETVSRAVRFLIDKKIAALDKHEVWLLDREKLEVL